MAKRIIRRPNAQHLAEMNDHQLYCAALLNVDMRITYGKLDPIDRQDAIDETIAQFIEIAMDYKKNHPAPWER